MSVGSKYEILASTGITPKEANRCEAIAALPEEEFEEVVKEATDNARGPLWAAWDRTRGEGRLNCH